MCRDKAAPGDASEGLRTQHAARHHTLIRGCGPVSSHTQPRVAAAEHIAKFNEDLKSPFVKNYRVIPHPGEVNKIREVPDIPHVVVTHTDAPEVRRLSP